MATPGFYVVEGLNLVEGFAGERTVIQLYGVEPNIRVLWIGGDATYSVEELSEQFRIVSKIDIYGVTDDKTSL